ncbi:response regulator [Candidatus Desantisbacteria bacterium]|nr:response regulator [Candidatus Desantisbacteria bacterium]
MSSSEDSLRALIVDDSGATRLRIKSILEKCGFGIIWDSMTGIESVVKCKALKPQLIVINVPDMMGIEVIKRMLSRDNTVKILLIGRPGQESYIGEAILIGATDYFLEPFKDKDVAEMVWKIFQ